MAEIGLIQKTKLKELALPIVELLAHPNRFIRFAAVGFINANSKVLKPIDIRCIIRPIIIPILLHDISNFSEISLLENVKTSVRRELYELAIRFANNDDGRGLNNFNSGGDR